ncbi:hypothetical protein [Novosphingobium resinovorum]|uniref:hypothetical protein n=1 Tax=Novosphingobium resinovorum TaxID=158500 RepID=UPI002ED6A675|nr:hypothetical protein [Novosphingobium resinovorum]
MGYKNAEKTRLALIKSAETLVAKRGLAGVSAREVCRLSGLKNNVAVQYHFTSVEQLYDEIVKHRMIQLEAIRCQRLQALGHNELAALTIDELVALVCLPHLRIRDENGGYPYAAFLCHYLPEKRPTGFNWAMEAGSSITPTMQRIITLLRNQRPNLPFDVFNRRMTNATLVFLNVLRGLPDSETRSDDVYRHPLILDGLRQCVALLNAEWHAPQS